jgi:LuxR family maltose regulon positive regulatory protein
MSATTGPSKEARPGIGAGAAYRAPGKFRPPSLPAFSVPRQTLLNTLSEQPSRLALVVAPAGYGKTTFLSQLYTREREAGSKVSWLSADQFDQEPVQFLDHIATALSDGASQTEPLMSRGLQANDSATLTERTNALCRELAAIAAPVLIMIDDYHLIDNGVIGEMVVTLLASMPLNCRMVIASRYRPRFSLAPLMARGQMLELSGLDLRFSLEEARQLLGADVPHEAAHQLNTWTQGWGIALQLAKLTIGHDLSKHSARMLPPSISDDLALYLSEQVFSKLPSAIQAFLIDTSVLCSLSEELCDEVRQRADSASIIRDLRSTYALLIPLSDGAWYTYHPLFSDFLARLLKEKEPGHAIALHARAARWYAAHNMLVDAIRHAREADDSALVASIVDRAGGATIILKYGYSVLQNILSVLPAEWQLAIPSLLLGKAAQLLKDGRIQEAEKYIARVKSDFSVEDFPGLENDILFAEMLWTGYADRGVDQGTIDRFESLTDSLPAWDSWLHAWSNNVLSLIYLRWGNLQKSQMYVQRAIRIYGDSQSHYMQSFCYLNIGVLHLMAGRQVEAYRSFRRAQRMVQTHFPADPAIRALSAVLLAAIHYERNQLNRAARLLDSSLAKAERYDGWTEIYTSAYHTQAGILYRLDGLRAALVGLDRAQETALQRNLPRLGWQIAIRRAELFLLDGQPAKAHALARESGLYDQLERGGEAVDFTWLEHQLASALVARIALHEGQPEIALSLIDRPRGAYLFHAAAFATQEMVIRAVAYERLGQPEQALATLVRGLGGSPVTTRLRTILDERTLLLPCLQRVVKETGLAKLPERVRDLYERLRRADGEGSTANSDQTLSPREREILAQLSQGKSNKLIAAELDLSLRTVKFHMQNIFTKLGVDNRTKALLVAQDIYAL